MNKYYKFNDGFFTFYVNALTKEKKFRLEEGDVEVESNLDDFSRTDCQSYEEAFCEARDCGECAFRE